MAVYRTKQTHTGILNAPVDRVWRHMMDDDELVEASPYIDSIVTIKGVNGEVGSVSRNHGTLPDGTAFVSDIEATEIVPGVAISWRSTVHPAPRVKSGGRRELEPLGDRTRVRETLTTETVPISWYAAVVLRFHAQARRRQARRLWEHQLEIENAYYAAHPD